MWIQGHKVQGGGEGWKHLQTGPRDTTCLLQPGSRRQSEDGEMRELGGLTTARKAASEAGSKPQPVRRPITRSRKDNLRKILKRCVCKWKPAGGPSSAHVTLAAVSTGMNGREKAQALQQLWEGAILDCRRVVIVECPLQSRKDTGPLESVS